MPKKIKGTETEKNLLKAFAGESQARNRYTFFSSAAFKEGFQQISAIFQETADNEKEHAKVFFKYLKGGDCEITASYPAGKIGKTSENLLEAANGEKMEWGTLYPMFEKTARKEGFEDVHTQYGACCEQTGVRRGHHGGKQGRTHQAAYPYGQDVFDHPGKGLLLCNTGE